MREIAGQRPFNAHGHTTGSDDPDWPLVVAAQRDRAEFALLYRKYVNPVHRFCYRRLGNRQAAEDATSHTFERALIALPTFRRGSFRAWLFTIARHTVSDVHRRDRTPDRLPEGWDQPDGGPGPEETALANEGRLALPDILRHLTADQRTVIELRLEGFTNAEIAQVMNRSAGSVRTLQYRALTDIRRHLDPGSHPGIGHQEIPHETE